MLDRIIARITAFNFFQIKKRTNYLRHPFITKTILRGVGAAVIIRVRVTRLLPTFYTVNCPGADTKARKNNQTNRQSLHVA